MNNLDGALRLAPVHAEQRISASLEEYCVIIPTYNEGENILLLVGGILDLPLGLKIIIVDDNSPDGTGQLADELASAHDSVRVIHRPGKLGLGTAHVAGMKAALESGASRIVTMDADFSHHPRYLPTLIKALDGLDVVIGSRYVAGGGTLYCSAPRRTLSRGANLLARAALNLPARDATAGFRGYRRSVIESIALGEIVSNGYSFLIEMLYLCQRQGWRIGEVPILFENRQRGTSKISRTEIVKAALTVVRLSGTRIR